MTAPAVLYICARRPRESTLAEERARAEGRRFAEEHGLKISMEIVDLYGESSPAKRPGWQQVRQLAAAGEIGTLILRWPNALSPDYEMRYPEVAALDAANVRILFSWAPLTAMRTGEHR